MKKLILSIIAFSFYFTVVEVNGQTPFPDGGFENCWEFFENYSPGKADYWDFKDGHFLTTLNMLHELTGSQGSAPLTAHKITGSEARQGNSLKLVSQNMTFGGEIIFLPGVAATMYVDIEGLDCILGKPFTARPTAIKGYMKYAPAGKDSAAIEVILREAGGLELGRGKQVFNEAINGWTEFNVGIDYNAFQTPPTSITVIFASSAKYDFTNIDSLMSCKGQVGSTMFLDDVEFLYDPTGIKEMLTPEIQLNVYPNPSAEKVTVHIEKEINGMVFIYDYLSRKVGEYSIDGTQLDINVKNYAAGSYLINVVENNKVVTTGRFVKQ